MTLPDVRSPPPTGSMLPRPTLGANPDLGNHILHVEVARLLRINTNGFRLVTDRFHLFCLKWV
jgi:hypothetical protein